MLISHCLMFIDQNFKDLVIDIIKLKHQVTKYLLVVIITFELNIPRISYIYVMIFVTISVFSSAYDYNNC